MASLTIRNIPDFAKLRFRQLAAAHGRSMEEHMRQLLFETVAEGEGPSSRLQEEQAGFARENQLNARPEPGEEDWVHELICIANGAGEGVFEREPQPLQEFDL
jgi:plasmid stability protein